MVDINKHTTIKLAYELCLEIEKFSASEEQTALITKANELMNAIAEYVEKCNKIQIFQCTKEDMFPYVVG